MYGPKMNLSSVNETLEEYEKYVPDRDESLAKIEVAILALIFIITVIGNSTVILALWARRRCAGRKKLSRMYFFILHLSIADLITAFLGVLPQLAWDITYRFYGGYVLCKMVKYGQTLGPYLSSYVLMATAIDRHQAICYPLTYCSWTSRRSKVMVYIAWLSSLIFCIPQLTIFSFQEVEEGVFDCWAYFEESWGQEAYVIWYCLSVFIVPLIVLVYTYTCICKEIWHSSEFSLRPRNSQSEGRGAKMPLISRAKINTVKQTIAVIVMYIVCSSPFMFAQLWSAVDPANPFFEGSIFTIVALLYSLNSCVNPWIYLAFNRELPKYLIRHYTSANKKYKSTAAGNHSASNSSGDIQSTSLRPLSRMSRNNSGKLNRCSNKLPNPPYMTKYDAKDWIVATAT